MPELLTFSLDELLYFMSQCFALPPPLAYHYGDEHRPHPKEDKKASQGEVKLPFCIASYGLYILVKSNKGRNCLKCKKKRLFLRKWHLVIFRHFLRLIKFNDLPVGQFEDEVFNCSLMMHGIFDDFVPLKSDKHPRQDSAGYDSRSKTFTS